MDTKRFAFIIGIIIILFGIVLLVGASQTSPLLLIVSMTATTISVSTPLILGALAGIFCERSGVVNIGIEGMMLSSAFFGWFGAICFNTFLGTDPVLSLVLGVVVALLTGALMGLLLAVLSVTFKVEQIIGGTVINILAVGVTGFLNRQLFFEKNGLFGGQFPHAPGVLPRIHIPLLADIPVLGKMFEQQPIAIAAIALVFICNFVVFNTRWGLRMRSVGEHPRAADTVGINVFRTRYYNVIIGGVLAGLAGAYFTLESVPSFEPLMTNGRGFIALAAMIFGNWSPIGAWAAALVFGASSALQINIQFYREFVPSQWAFINQAYVIGMVPYVLTMLILTGMIGKTTPPAAENQPYEK
jgi:general nucleoside transport system permease protein